MSPRTSFYLVLGRKILFWHLFSDETFFGPISAQTLRKGPNWSLRYDHGYEYPLQAILTPNCSPFNDTTVYKRRQGEMETILKQ